MAKFWNLRSQRTIAHAVGALCFGPISENEQGIKDVALSKSEGGNLIYELGGWELQ